MDRGTRRCLPPAARSRAPLSCTSRCPRTRCGSTRSRACTLPCPSLVCPRLRAKPRRCSRAPVRSAQHVGARSPQHHQLVVALCGTPAGARTTARAAEPQAPPIFRRQPATTALLLRAAPSAKATPWLHAAARCRCPCHRGRRRSPLCCTLDSFSSYQAVLPVRLIDVICGCKLFKRPCEGF